MNDGLILMVVGMAVVFIGLSLMAVVVVTLRRFLTEPPPPTPTVEKVEHEEKADQQAQIDTQLIAILTAAASAALGLRVRVFRVGFVTDEWNVEHHSWVQQARSELHTSHRPRH